MHRIRLPVTERARPGGAVVLEAEASPLPVDAHLGTVYTCGRCEADLLFQPPGRVIHGLVLLCWNCGALNDSGAAAGPG